MSQLKSIARKHQMQTKRQIKIKIKKHLNADALLNTVRSGFGNIQDHRNKNTTIPLQDAIMSGFAMFSIKSSSLLAFDGQRQDHSHNLRTIFGIGKIPCDSSMREILDELNPIDLRPGFKAIFAKLQRSKALEKFAYMNDCYLLSLDGTGYFSSSVLYSPSCMEKVNKKTGKTIKYYLQMLGASIVHPDRKEVIPLCPEPIKKTGWPNKK